MSKIKSAEMEFKAFVNKPYFLENAQQFKVLLKSLEDACLEETED